MLKRQMHYGFLDCYTASNIVSVINEWVHNDKHRKILRDRLVNGMTFEKLAEKYSSTPTSIKKIVYKYESVIEDGLKVY